MARATARKYERHNGVWTHTGDSTWKIRPLLWPLISAYVVRRPFKPARLSTVLFETNLLMNSTNWQNGSDLSWSQPSMSYPSHMSRFLTESLGLCISLNSAADYGWTVRRQILDADRLPTEHPAYVAKGSRPDFVYRSATGWHGVEARGRSAPAPSTTSRPSRTEQPKLEGMDRWSATVASHPSVNSAPSWSMSWSWITDTDTTVDHYDPGDPVPSSQEIDEAVWERMREITSELTDDDDPGVQHVEGLGRPVSTTSRPLWLVGSAEPSQWLTIASWTDRLTESDFLELRDNESLESATESSFGLLESPDHAEVGAFMATAITTRAPTANELDGLLRAALLAASTDR